jgi:hypothetical protein
MKKSDPGQLLHGDTHKEADEARWRIPLPSFCTNLRSSLLFASSPRKSILARRRNPFAISGDIRDMNVVGNQSVSLVNQNINLSLDYRIPGTAFDTILSTKDKILSAGGTGHYGTPTTRMPPQNRVDVQYMIFDRLGRR